MTKHTLSADSITTAKALVSRLCENGHIRMSVPVDFDRDEDMLICALIGVAEKLLATPAPTASGAEPADLPNIVKIVEEFVEDYEMRGEDAEGRDCDYSPNETEKCLILDAIWGLLEHDEFKAAFDPDAARYRRFFASGLPITFMGVEYNDKASLDAAIDADLTQEGKAS